MNTFQLNYEARLKNWYELRAELKDKKIEEIAVRVDEFWQRCPLMGHYLHPIDIDTWPDPWELISDNSYCVYARALGMIYTLLLLGVDTIDLVEAKDDNSEEVTLVLVDNAKYILNYWPNTVVNNNLDDFSAVTKIDLTPIIKKTGRT